MTDEDLVLVFVESRLKRDRDQVIVAFMPLVERVARSMNTPPHVEIEDLVGYGYFGLIRAVERFDPARGVTFDTYASSVIRGGIKQELRRADWATRTARQRTTQLQEATENLQHRLGRRPTTPELAVELGVEETVVEQMRTTAERMNLVTAEQSRANDSEGGRPRSDFMVSSREQDAAADIALDLVESSVDVADAVDALEEPWRTVLLLHLLHGLTNGEIAKECGVAASRVSTLHTEAITMVTERLRAL